MAKKSTATRQQSTTPRRPQTARPSNVTLVRASSPAAETEKAAATPSSTPVGAAQAQAQAQTKTATPGTVAAKKPAVEKSAAEKPAAEKRAPTAPTAPAVVRPRAPEINTRPKSSPPRPQSSQQQGQLAGGSAAAKAQAVRVARARAVQRARTANLVTPEHYSYVIRDLKLIAALACAMVIVLIVLHFALPA